LLIYRYGCADVEGGILEASTIFQSSNVPAEHAGSTAVQTAHKDVLAVPFMFLWHNFADSGFPERLPLAGLSGPGNDKLSQYWPDFPLPIPFTMHPDALNQRPGICPTTIEGTNYGIASFTAPN